jgi:hypothetical protein
MARRPTLPNFVVIGAAGCATRWLRFHLNRHPDVFVPPHSLDFFADGVPPFEGPPFGDARRTASEGLRWYRHQFLVPEGIPCVGDVSPSYLAGISHPPTIAARIAQVLPDVPVVALIRQPVARMYAVMLDQARRGNLPPDPDLYALVAEQDPLVTELDLVAGGLYAQNLTPFRHLFGDRLLVVLHEDVLADPATVYRRVLGHIGADPEVVVDGLERVVFDDPGVIDPASLTEAQGRRLFSLFRGDVDELEIQLDRDLSGWDPGPPDGEDR